MTSRGSTGIPGSSRADSSSGPQTKASSTDVASSAKAALRSSGSGREIRKLERSAGLIAG